MAYKVINPFIERQHDGHLYEVGDVYPVEGKRLNKSRAEELTKVHAVYGKVYLIAEPKKADKPSTEEKSDA